MPRTIFYSWQSDLPNPTNRGFIETALERAVKAIVADGTLGLEPVIDRDTQGIPGAPEIAKAIFAKIDKAEVFVADVSIVNGQHGGRPTPNPNVLFELGYALKALGDERIILVLNREYGEVEQLPFDLRMRRTLKYKMAVGNTDRAAERNDLQAQLEGALRDALAGIAKTQESVRIQNRDGASGPLLITGSQQSAQDKSLRVLWGVLKIVNRLPHPVSIAPIRLIVGGSDWPVHSVFFQTMAPVVPRDKEITVPGNDVTERKLVFMFAEGKSPEGKTGTVVFRIDDEERAYSVAFAGAV